MPRRTDMLAVVVACDDGPVRERVATALAAEAGIEVLATVDTVRTGPSTTRLKPDAIVMISPRPRYVDLGRIGTLARERAKRSTVVVLLADDPASIGERARAAGAALVTEVPAADAAGLAAELRRLCRR